MLRTSVSTITGLTDMNRLKTINAVIQFDLIKIRHGISEKLPMFYYKLREEVRYNPNHDEKGRFATGDGISGKSDTSSDNDKISAKSVDKPKHLGYTERKEAAQNMSPFEVEVVSSYLHTNFPDFEINGERHYKSVGDHKYVFKVRGHGSYEFLEKEPIDRSDGDDD